MEQFIEKIKAFIAAIKDDPGLSDVVRFAANELHDALNPPDQAAPETPAQPAEPAAPGEQAQPAATPETPAPPVDPAASGAPAPPAEG